MVFVSDKAVKFLKEQLRVTRTSKRDEPFNVQVWHRAIRLCQEEKPGQEKVILTDKHLSKAWDEIHKEEKGRY